MRRLASHLIVAAALLGTALDLQPIEPASAAPDPKPTAPPALIAYSPPTELPRATVTDRAAPAPLPQPVPVDPDATPLPAPTIPAPAPVIPSLRWPLAGTVTTWYSAGHPAVDVAASCGTPVHAPSSGTITFAGWRNNGGGYVLDIDHGWALTSLNHLNGFAVTSGYVTAGQLVAYVGSTGNSRGCHVHWALLVDGTWRNALAWT